MLSGAKHLAQRSARFLAALGRTMFNISRVRAILWTDVLQAILFGTVMILGGGAICLAAVSAGTSVEDALKAHPTGFRIESGAGGGVMTLALIWTFGYILLPHMWQRMLMARDPRTLIRTVPWSSGMALIVIVIPSLLMGLFGPALLGTVADSDMVIPTLWQKYLGGVYWMLMLAACAAGMSTMDSQMLTAASVIQRDVLGWRDRKPHPWLLRGTVAILTLTFAALALTPQVSKNIILLASKGTGVAFLLGPPTFFLVFGWRCHPWAVTLGLGLGLTAVVFGDMLTLLPSLPGAVGYPVAGTLVVLLCMLLGRSEEIDGSS